MFERIRGFAAWGGRGPSNNSHLAKFFCLGWYNRQYGHHFRTSEDGLEHYLKIGWKAGQDPSASFSTTWYLAENDDVRQAGLNPLVHYVRSGLNESRKPHPLLEPLAPNEENIGIAVVSFNAPQALRLTLDSVFAAANQTRFKVFLIENGSKEDCQREVREMAEGYIRRGLPLEFIDNGKNLGFSGGNNVAIRRAIDQRFSHVCLLNSDVIVADHWLDRLVGFQEPVIGPVANAAGNEQTVPIPYTASMDAEPASLVRTHAAARWSLWRNSLFPTDFLGFFCVLIRREAIEKIGLLDERFFPGSYEDDDYCVRLLDAGFRLAVARGVYMHHWGSQSFSVLEFEERVEISNINRERFEEKYGHPWQDRTHLLVRSWLQDEASLEGAPSNAVQDELRRLHASISETMVDRLVAGVHHYRHVIQGQKTKLAKWGGKVERLRAEAKASEAAIAGQRSELKRRKHEIRALRAQLVELEAAGDSARPAERVALTFGAPSPGVRDLTESQHRIYSEMLARYWASVEKRQRVGFASLLGAQALLHRLAIELAKGSAVTFFANNTDPARCDPRDGYSQRVLEIDAALSPSVRFYVRFDKAFKAGPQLHQIADATWTIELTDGEAAGQAVLEALTAQTACYFHSILPLKHRGARMIVEGHPRLYLDVHGVVPEEFAMCGDPFGAQIHADYEQQIVANARTVICVSDAMRVHLQNKYPTARYSAVVCPIFTTASTETKARQPSKRPRAIYAGGIQRWQQIPKMLRAVAATTDWCDHKILVPDPSKLDAELEAALGGRPPAGVSIGSATPEEVAALYPLYDFGYILREDSVVNAVSCPTKLVEYLAHGVIPVMDTDAVGDFAKLGMQFVKLDDFVSGSPPNAAKRQAMAAHNREVISGMATRARVSLSELIADLTSLPNRFSAAAQ